MSRRVSALKWSNTSQQKRPRETPGPNSLSGFEIVLHPCCVVVIHGQRCVVERSQQVLPHIPHKGGVLFEAHKDEPQVIAVQLHELSFHNLGGLIVARAADEAASAAHSVH